MASSSSEQTSDDPPDPDSPSSAEGSPPLNPYAVPARDGAVPRYSEFYHPLLAWNNIHRILLGFLLTIGSFGVFYLLGLWFPRVACRVWRRRGVARDIVASWAKKRANTIWGLDRASEPCVLVREDRGWTRADLGRNRIPDWAVRSFQNANGMSSESAVWKYLFRYSYRGVKWHYHPLLAEFVEHSPVINEGELPVDPRPVSERQAQVLRIRDGRNSLEFPLTPWYVLLGTRLLSPFFVFQVLASIIWFYEGEASSRARSSGQLTILLSRIPHILDPHFRHVLWLGNMGGLDRRASRARGPEYERARGTRYCSQICLNHRHSNTAAGHCEPVHGRWIKTGDTPSRSFVHQIRNSDKRTRVGRHPRPPLPWIPRIPCSCSSGLDPPARLSDGR
jgi:hypothetical protein